ncbi:NAD-dependent deacylase, partial [Pseudomonas syringae]|uniref:Sir2 family NAD-dependent protein deacetylase n=3 Tax=Pseudomonas TaxID=286 RepID=UPI001F2AA899
MVAKGDSVSVFGLATEALKDAKKIVCFSGAGISAESGIPTYLDQMPDPWTHHDPRALETAKAFRENPELVWGWYLWRRRMVARAQPNAAHLALAQMASFGYPVSVVTQNIDDLHERANSTDVIHLHGSLAVPKCFACHRPAELTRVQIELPDGEEMFVDPPRCIRCRGKLRPGVVWYGENLSLDAWKSAVALMRGCDVLISVGTSGIVTPAADLPHIALSSG